MVRTDSVFTKQRFPPPGGGHECAFCGARLSRIEAGVAQTGRRPNPAHAAGDSGPSGGASGGANGGACGKGPASNLSRRDLCSGCERSFSELSSRLIALRGRLLSAHEVLLNRLLKASTPSEASAGKPPESTEPRPFTWLTNSVVRALPTRMLERLQEQESPDEDATAVSRSATAEFRPLTRKELDQLDDALVALAVRYYSTRPRAAALSGRSADGGPVGGGARQIAELLPVFSAKSAVAPLSRLADRGAIGFFGLEEPPPALPGGAPPGGAPPGAAPGGGASTGAEGATEGAGDEGSSTATAPPRFYYPLRRPARTPPGAGATGERLRSQGAAPSGGGSFDSGSSEGEPSASKPTPGCGCLPAWRRVPAWQRGAPFGAGVLYAPTDPLALACVCGARRGVACERPGERPGDQGDGHSEGGFPPSTNPVVRNPPISGLAQAALGLLELAVILDGRTHREDDGPGPSFAAVLSLLAASEILRDWQRFWQLAYGEAASPALRRALYRVQNL